MIDAKVADKIIRNGTIQIASQLVNSCETVDDRRHLLNAFPVLIERLADETIWHIHALMDIEREENAVD